MYGIEKIIELIRTESEVECKDIAVKANKENTRLSTIYSQKEKDTYTSYVSEGTYEINKRVEQLTKLANEQAKKMVHTAEQGVLDDVLEMAAKKLSALPAQKYSAVLERLGLEPECTPEQLVEQYRDDLAPSVISALFDSGGT